MKIKEIVDLIYNSIYENRNFFWHMDVVIVGENKAGKSNLLKDIIKKIGFDKAYFIDDKNRCIPSIRGLSSDKFDKFNASNVVEIRLNENNFNKCDVFSENSGSEVALEELISNKSKYISLFEEVLDIRLTIPEESNQGDIEVTDIVEEIFFDNTNLIKISSGLQSKIRILMEVNYAYENGYKVVIIDEFNTNLDFKNSYLFFQQLKSKYSDIRFIITSHSIYTVKGIENIDVIKIYKQYEDIYDNVCEAFDGDDLDNLEIIDKKLFGGSNKTNEKDIELSNCLKNVVSNKEISEDEKKMINEIKDLTPRQKIVCEYIKKVIEKNGNKVSDKI